MRYQRTTLLSSIALALITFSLYLPTMARSIWLEDSAELITGAHTLSVIHPSGYPTFLLLGKLASLMPFGDSIAVRVNALTLLFAVAAAVLLYGALKKLFAPGIAFMLSLLFATSPMVWTQATYAEVYSLNTLFLILLLLLYLRWREKPSIRRLCALAFAYGLSLTNHFLPLVALPLILGWLFLSLRAKRSNPNNAPRRDNAIPSHSATLRLPRSWVHSLAMTGCFLLGLLPYLYIPVRAAAEPPINWFGGDIAKLVSYNIAYGWRISSETLRYLTDQFDLIAASYGWVGILLVAAGLVLMVRKRHTLSIATFGLGALYSIGLVVALTNGREYAEFAGWFYQFLYIPLLIIILIPIGVALQKLHQSRFRLFAFYTLLLALLAMPAFDLGERFIANDRSEYVFLERYTKSLLSSLPQDSTLFIHHDHIINDTLLFGTAYQQYVKNIRQDIDIRSLTPVFPLPEGFPANLLPEHAGREEELFRFYFASLSSVPHTTLPMPGTGGNGFAYSMAPTTDAALYVPDNLALPSAQNNLYHSTLVAKYYYDHAAWLYSQGAFKSGQWFLIQAIEYDPEDFGNYYKRIVALRDAYMQN